MCQSNKCERTANKRIADITEHTPTGALYTTALYDASSSFLTFLTFFFSPSLAFFLGLLTTPSPSPSPSAGGGSLLYLAGLLGAASPPAPPAPPPAGGRLRLRSERFCSFCCFSLSAPWSWISI